MDNSNNVGSFLQKYKDKISVINKHGHMGVAMNANKPITKNPMSSRRNFGTGIKNELVSITQNTSSEWDTKKSIKESEPDTPNKIEGLRHLKDLKRINDK